MNIKQDSYGARRFKLGIVEFGIVSVAIATGLWLLSQQYQGMIKTQQEQTKSITALTTQIAVMSDQITTLTAQLANVPALTVQLAQMKAEVDEHERRIERLENQRGVQVKAWTHP